MLIEKLDIYIALSLYLDVNIVSSKLIDKIDMH
jgi:hypothetical protein